MKSPRTLLTELQEAGCRMAGFVGIRNGYLLLSEDRQANLAIARNIRSLAWPFPPLKEAMEDLASCIERRSHPQRIDSRGVFYGQAGKLLQTPESIAAAKEFYK